MGEAISYTRSTWLWRKTRARNCTKQLPLRTSCKKGRCCCNFFFQVQSHRSPILLTQMERNRRGRNCCNRFHSEHGGGGPWHGGKKLETQKFPPPNSSVWSIRRRARGKRKKNHLWDSFSSGYTPNFFLSLLVADDISSSPISDRKGKKENFSFFLLWDFVTLFYYYTSSLRSHFHVWDLKTDTTDIKKHSITDISQTRKEEKKSWNGTLLFTEQEWKCDAIFCVGKRDGRRDGAEKCCCCLQPPFRALWGKGTCVEKRDLLFASLARSCCVFLFLQKPQNSHGTKKTQRISPKSITDRLKKSTVNHEHMLRIQTH